MTNKLLVLTISSKIWLESYARTHQFSTKLMKLYYNVDHMDHVYILSTTMIDTLSIIIDNNTQEHIKMNTNIDKKISRYNSLKTFKLYLLLIINMETKYFT